MPRLSLIARACALLSLCHLPLAHAVPIAVEAHQRHETVARAEPSEFDAQAAALLERWSPNFAQESSPEHPERDRPTRIDFDGDWDATNNWSHLTPQIEHAPPVVYGSAVLTDTHAYLTFTLFYPRDWSTPVCVSYLCHDNDLEVVLLVVRRAANPSGETLAYAESKAHMEYVAVRGSEIATDAAGRPWMRIESEGHGMFPVHSGAAPASGVRRFVARSSPEAASVENQIYELASLRETLWARRDPAGSRSLWTGAGTGFLVYSGSRMGRRGKELGAAMAGREYAGGVRPPWGLRARAGERGDWFFDPAYVAQLEHPGWLSSNPSLDYAYNPFLDDLTSECRGQDCPAILPQRSATPADMGVVGGLVLVTGLVSLRARPRVRARWRRFWLRSRGR